MKHRSAAQAVFNQTPPLEEYNLYAGDAALQEAVRRDGAAAADPGLWADGAALGTAENFEHARLANRHAPVLNKFNVRGERIDRVEFHPSWHVLMQGIVARGYHTGPWAGAGAGGIAVAGGHTARAAGYFMQ